MASAGTAPGGQSTAERTLKLTEKGRAQRGTRADEVVIADDPVVEPVDVTATDHVS